MKIALYKLMGIIVFIVGGISCQNVDKTQTKSDGHYEKVVLGHWEFDGHLGAHIDKIAQQRIVDKKNWEMIYPETEEAFRLREDDRDYPERGVWRGEFWGKYILSVIAAARYYHSDELKSRIAEAVKGISQYQDENGYIGTYKHSDFVEGDNWNVWGRKYTLWGLVEAWELLGDDSILEIAQRFADQLISEVGPGAVDIIKTGNFYGMPSSSILQPMVKLYNATGDKKYLDYAEYIVGQWSKHPDGLPDILNKGLSGEPVHKWFPETDPYKWAKGYEFTSCVEGLLELYQATGNHVYFTAVKNIYSALVATERTPIGSVSFNDKFVGSAGIINTASEVCDAVYWNRLSFKLFEITGDAKYIDEIERTLYNSLLSSSNTEGTWALRRIRMSHVHVPAHNHFLNHHQCCTDNLPRGLFQASEIVLGKRNNDVFLTLFNKGEGTVPLPSGQLAKLKIEGDFLNESKVIVVLSLEKAEKFTLKVRQPKWSKHTSVFVNGEKQSAESLERWLNINRTWNDNDTVEIDFDLSVWWEAFDTGKSKDLYDDLEFYDTNWAGMKFKTGTNEEMNRKYMQMKVENLMAADALPNSEAVTFFYGPLALSRDVRVTEGDIFSGIQFVPAADSVFIHSVNPPEGVWKVFGLNLGHGKTYRFCDFSSAGNTWDINSKFNTWCILKNEK